jgi:hypothetical protein
VNKTRLKRKQLEFNLVKCDLEDVKDSLRVCNQHFNNKFIHKSEIMKESQEEVQEEAREEVQEEESSNEREEKTQEGANKDISKESRSLFKKIAIKSHPDKMLNLEEEEREEMEALYLIAQRAVADDDLATLIEIAAELGIDSGIAQETQIKIIQQKIDFIREKMHNIKQAAAWVWYHSDENQKDQIEEQLTGQMGFKRKI